MPIHMIPPLAFGTPGLYWFEGSFVKFVDDGTPLPVKLFLGAGIGQYFESFVHELGHSLGWKHVTDRFGEIVLHSGGSAFCRLPSYYGDISPTANERAFVSLAGPLAVGIFAIIQAIGIQQTSHWMRKFNGNRDLGRFQSIIIKMMKMRNIMPLISPLGQLYNFLGHRYMGHTHELGYGDDFLSIQHYGGDRYLAGSIIGLCTLSFVAVKIMNSGSSPKKIKKPKTTLQRCHKAIIKICAIFKEHFNIFFEEVSLMAKHVKAQYHHILSSKNLP